VYDHLLRERVDAPNCKKQTRESIAARAPSSTHVHVMCRVQAYTPASPKACHANKITSQQRSGPTFLAPCCCPLPITPTGYRPQPHGPCRVRRPFAAPTHGAAAAQHRTAPLEPRPQQGRCHATRPFADSYPAWRPPHLHLRLLQQEGCPLAYTMPTSAASTWASAAGGASGSRVAQQPYNVTRRPAALQCHASPSSPTMSLANSSSI